MNKCILFIMASTFLVAHPVFAKPVYKGPYKASVDRVIDGDTLAATVEIWPGISTYVKIRLKGVDTPELKGECPFEIKKARDARNFLVKNMKITKKTVVTLTNVFRGKYAGRVVADVDMQGVNLSDALLKASLGRPYRGGKRRSWCTSN